MSLVITIAAVLVYFVIGYFLALRNIPRSLAVAKEEWFTSSNQKSSIRMQFFGMFLFWFIYLPVVLAKKKVDGLVADRDPEQLKAKMDLQRKRIEALEKETDQLRLQQNREYGL